MVLHFNFLTDQVVQDRSRRIVHYVLKGAVISDQFLVRLRDTFFQIEFIQRKFRTMREIMKQRTFALRHPILTQQTFLINNSLILSKKASNKQISMKITRLSDAKKDFITECFINLAKFDFRKQFLIWFRDTKLDIETPEGLEKVQEVEEGIAQTE